MVELSTILNSEFDIYKERHSSHVHLKAPLTGIGLTTSYVKLALDTTNFHIRTLGGFTFDDTNDRIYWDSGGAIGRSLPVTFIGDAGIEITAGLSGTMKVTLGLFFDEVLVLETPISFSVIDKIQGYGANGILTNISEVSLLQSGSYWDVRAKVDSGTPTITLAYFQVTIQRR